jgi:hypothetical protein
LAPKIQTGLGLSLKIFLTASLALHAFSALYFYLPRFSEKTSGSQSVTISYVIPEKTMPVKQALSPKKPSLAKQDVLPEKIEVLKSSAELLADPKKGVVFLDYYGRIKEKIQNRIRQKYSAKNMKGESATLFFVLRSNGALDKVWVDPRASEASSQALDFAGACLRQAAPFDAFPKELDSDKISFRLTIVFDEL